MIEGTKVRLAISACVLVLHVLWVIYVAALVKKVCQRGDNGLQLWVLVAIPDLPSSYLAEALVQVLDPGGTGDLWFWSYTWYLWAYAVLGSFQWALFTWLALWAICRIRRRSLLKHSFPIVTETQNQGTGIEP